MDAPCLRVVTPFLPVIKLTSSIPLVVVFCGMMGFLMGAPCFSNCAMFLQMHRVFIDAPLFFAFSDCAKNFGSKIL